jgi:hypothetical protein
VFAVGDVRSGVYAPRVPWDPGTVDVPLISLTIHHGRTQEEARRRLETAVHEVPARFGTMLRRVEWAADCNRVKLEGVGFGLRCGLTPEQSMRQGMLQFWTTARPRD